MYHIFAKTPIWRTTPKMADGGSMSKGGEIDDVEARELLQKIYDKQLSTDKFGYFPLPDWEKVNQEKIIGGGRKGSIHLHILNNSYAIESRTQWGDQSDWFYIYDKDFNYKGSANRISTQPVKSKKLHKKDFANMKDISRNLGASKVFSSGGSMADGGEAGKKIKAVVKVQYKNLAGVLDKGDKVEIEVVPYEKRTELVRETTKLNKETGKHEVLNAAVFAEKGSYKSYIVHAKGKEYSEQGIYNMIGNKSLGDIFERTDGKVLPKKK